LDKKLLDKKLLDKKLLDNNMYKRTTNKKGKKTGRNRKGMNTYYYYKNNGMLDIADNLRKRNYSYQKIADELNKLGYYRKPTKEGEHKTITWKIVQNLFNLKYISLPCYSVVCNTNNERKLSLSSSIKNLSFSIKNLSFSITQLTSFEEVLIRRNTDKSNLRGCRTLTSNKKQIQTMIKKLNIVDLPNDLLVLIFSYIINPLKLRNICFLCKKFYSVFYVNILWKNILCNEFKFKIELNNKNELYIYYYKIYKLIEYLSLNIYISSCARGNVREPHLHFIFFMVIKK
jgi:hypothetical protein